MKFLAIFSITSVILIHSVASSHRLGMPLQDERHLEPENGGQCVAPLGGDGPPALEDVCDQYEGKAKGLCNAYCEAKDCDAAVYEDAKSCIRIKEAFQALTGETDLPCERCPCWELIPGVSRYSYAINIDQSYLSLSLNLYEYYYRTLGSYGYYDTGKLRPMDSASPYFCLSVNDSRLYTSMFINEAQYNRCRDDVIDHWTTSETANICIRPEEPEDPSTECPCWNDAQLDDAPTKEFWYDSVLQTNNVRTHTIYVRGLYMTTYRNYIDLGSYCRASGIVGTIFLTDDQIKKCLVDMHDLSVALGRNTGCQ